MKRILRLIPILLIITGIGICLAPKSKQLHNDYTQGKILDQWVATLHDDIQINEKEGKQETDTKILSDDKSQDVDLSILEKYQVNSVIIIPKIELKLPVLDKLTKTNLNIAPCYSEGSSSPGEIGNCIISGHRSLNYGRHFNRLGELKLKDNIIVQEKKAKFTYEITDIFIVEPTEMWVTDKSEEKIITLITCEPIETGTHRLIIRGKLTNKEIIETI